MKEYQIRMEGYRLPEEVYHQCLWIVRDMERSIGLFASFMAGDRGELPLQVSSAGQRICAVSRALEMVPAEYRQGIIESILKRGAASGITPTRTPGKDGSSALSTELP